MSTSPVPFSTLNVCATPADSGALPGVVLDSNAVFDWLVFRQPAMLALGEAIAMGRLRWLASAGMADEVAHVLGRGALGRRQPDAQAWQQTWQHAWSCWATVLGADLPALQGPALRLRCRDTDDQKFIDLALATRARWLVTRDKDLLHLARRARPLGLSVLTPEAWLREQTDAATRS